MSGEPSAMAEPDVQPWPGILTQPRRALRIAADRGSWAAPLAFLLLALVASAALEHFTSGAGAGAGAAPASSESFADDLRAMALALAMGVGMFAVVFMLLPWGLGHMLGGRATIGQVVVVMLWSTVPGTLLNLPLDLTALALHGSAWWSMRPSLFEPESWRALPASAQFIKLVGLTIGFWMAGLQVIGLSEVHRFSKLRATLVTILPLLVLGVLAAMAMALLVATMASKG